MSWERPGEGSGGLQASAVTSNPNLITSLSCSRGAQPNNTCCLAGCQWPGPGRQRARQAAPEGAAPDAWAGHGVRRDRSSWPGGAWGHCPAGAGSRCVLS